MPLRRSITAAALILFAGCGNITLLGGGGALSYAQYHSLEKGMGTKAILNAFGAPRETLEREGKLRGLSYRCENAAGQVVVLRMAFDPRGRLEKWALQEPS